MDEVSQCTYVSLKYIFIKTLLLQTYLFFKKRFMYLFWLLWVFAVAYMLSLVAVSGSYSLVVVHGLLIAVVSLIVEHGL